MFKNLFFWTHRTACGIIVPQPGIEPVPPAVEVQSPNHWTSREVPKNIFFKYFRKKDVVLICASKMILTQSPCWKIKTWLLIVKKIPRNAAGHVPILSPLLLALRFFMGRVIVVISSLETMTYLLLSPTQCFFLTCCTAASWLLIRVTWRA